MAPQSIKGLSNFISSIRSCSSKEIETERVRKEIAKIRIRFTSPQVLSGYERKKCIWKLVYCYMLGYEISFGEIEAVNLVSSSKYSEKAAGYIACSLLLIDNVEVLTLIINIIKADLHSGCEATSALALNFLANVATTDMTEILVNDVQRLASITVSSYIQSKAYLVLLRFARRSSDFISIDIWYPKLIENLQVLTDISCLSALASFILGLLELLPRINSTLLIAPVTHILWRISLKEIPVYGLYSGTAVPWLQIKLLRILQFIPKLGHSEAILGKLSNIIRGIISYLPSITKSSGSHSVSKRKTKKDQGKLSQCNIEYAIFFEAINVVLSFDTFLDPSLKSIAANTLGLMNSIKDSNVRYLRLEALARLAIDSDIVQSLQPQTRSILSHMYEQDISIQRQALNLLFMICNSETWQPVVDELVLCLKRTLDMQLRDDLVLKIAFLVEQHAPNLTWYIDTVFTMIEVAPGAINDDLWHRAIQIITGDDTVNDNLQMYAARKAYDSLADRYADDCMVRFGGYILGEFGYLITEEAPMKQQLGLLYRHFLRVVSNGTKALLLIAFAKMFNANNDIYSQVIKIFEEHAQSGDMEVQQRAVELRALCNLSATIIEDVLACMPSYPSVILKNSALAQRLHSTYKKGAVTRNVLENVASGSTKLTTLLSDESLSSEEDEITVTVKSTETENEDSENNHSQQSSVSSDSSDVEDSNSVKKNVPVSSHQEISLMLPFPKQNDLIGLWKRLCLLPEGPLITMNIEVMIKQQFKNGIGRMLAVISNPSNRPIQLQNIVIEHIPALSTRIICTPISDPNVPYMLHPKTSTKHAIEMNLMQCFSRSPTYSFYGYVSAMEPFVYHSSLPILITSFVTPVELTELQFKQYWETTQTSLDTQIQTRTNRLHPDISHFDAIETYCSVGFHFFCQRMKQSYWCSGSLLFSGSVSGSQSIPPPLACLFKIEQQSTHYRDITICVRTPHRAATIILLDILSLYLFIPTDIPTNLLKSQRIPQSYISQEYSVQH